MHDIATFNGGCLQIIRLILFQVFLILWYLSYFLLILVLWIFYHIHHVSVRIEAVKQTFKVESAKRNKNTTSIVGLLFL